MLVPSPLPEPVTRDVTAFVHSLAAAVRARQMYSAAHPASAAAIARLCSAATALASHQALQLGVSPTTVMVNGDALTSDRRIAEAALLLHDHDILRFRLLSAPSESELAAFLEFLALQPDVARRGGGPAGFGREGGHRSIEIDQIDYGAILAAPATTATMTADMFRPGAEDRRARRADPAAARDALWRALVISMSGGPLSFQRQMRERIRQVASSAYAVHALTSEAIEALQPGPGTGHLAAQAATVLTVFERLVSQIEATAPEQVPETLRNIASAAARMDPDLLMRVLGESAESGMAADVTGAIGGWFDDGKVARLLARSMAADGRASGRLASALHLLAPDPDRQQRVLRLARQITTGEEDSTSNDLSAAWHALDQILAGPSDSVYTSADYAAQLQEAELRSHRLRLQSPEHLDAWLDSVATDSMHALTATLLLGLLALEESPTVLSELAGDLEALTEDLLRAADIHEANRVLAALGPNGLGADPRRASVGRQALDEVGRSPALAELASSAADFDAQQFEGFQSICGLLGPIVIDTLLPVFVAMPDGVGRQRISTVITSFGDRPVGTLRAMLDSPEWPECRAAIQLLGRLGGAEAVAALQAFFRDPDTRRLRESVMALVALDDPHARRALGAALTAGTPDARRVSIEALAASRHHHAGPLIASALRMTNPFGRDHDIVLGMLAALRTLSDVGTVPIIAETMYAFSWLHMVRTWGLRRAAVDVLVSMGGEQASAALTLATQRGDMFLRKHARRALHTGD